MKKIILSLGVCIAVVSSLNAQQQMIENFRKSLLGQPLADFNFTGIQKEKLSKKQLEGKVIVMNLWFTSCKPCIQEMPLLNEVVATYKNKEVVFIAPALDEDAQVRKFLKKYTFDYKIVSGQLPYADKMKVEVFPTHLITDKKGIIREVLVGYHADIKEQLGKAIDGLL